MEVVELWEGLERLAWLNGHMNDEVMERSRTLVQLIICARNKRQMVEQKRREEDMRKCETERIIEDFQIMQERMDRNFL